MRKKRNIVIGISLLAGMVLVIGVGVLRNLNLSLPTDNLWTGKGNAEDTVSSIHQEKEVYFDPGHPSDYWQDELSAEALGLKVTVNRIEITKKADDLVRMELRHAQTDQEGSIIDSYSYFKVYITLENLESEPQKLGLNTNRLLIYQGDRILDDMEMQTASGKEGTGADKGFYIRTLEPGQSSDFVLGFVVPDDKSLEGCDVLFLFNPPGLNYLYPDPNQYVPPLTGNAAFIRLNSLIKDAT